MQYQFAHFVTDTGESITKEMPGAEKEVFAYHAKTPFSAPGKIFGFQRYFLLERHTSVIKLLSSEVSL